MQISSQTVVPSDGFPANVTKAVRSTLPAAADNTTTCPCCGTRIEAKIPIVDLNTNTVSWRGHGLKMRPQQVEIFHVLARKFPHIATREAIVNALWAPDTQPDTGMKAIDVHMCAIRKLLVGTGMSVDVVWGRGYVLRLEEPASC